MQAREIGIGGLRRRHAHAMWAALLAGVMAADAGTAQELPVPCTSCAGGKFVTSGQAQYSVSGSVGTIRQQTDRAILNWQKFNIGAGGTVNFQQPSTNSAALNRIHQNDPSRILGNLNANGQVYLINQNGIVFGQGAQVNTRALTASTLNMSDEVFNDLGVEGAISQGKAAFEHNPADGAMGSISIEKGAVLQTPEGGRVLVLAPEVVNKGTIRTPGGQTTLAASKDKVYITTGYVPAGQLKDAGSQRSVSDLRGILVEVDTGGSVTNLGTVIAERGDIGLVGLAVNQGGTLRATTSVKERGTVRLVARDRAVVTAGDRASPDGIVSKTAPLATRTGRLTLGANSVTEVVPDGKGGTAVDSQTRQESTVELAGRNIALESGATVRAPSGKVLVTATDDPRNPSVAGKAANDATVTMAPGSRIDVAGLNSAVVPMSRNVVEVELRGSQLADSPQQRNGPLRNKTVKVDIRTGTPFANVDATIAGLERPLDERMATGGAVSIWSEGSVTIPRGATVDFSGGSVRYESGYIDTTKLVTAQGRIVDIGEADPSIQYLGIFGELDVEHEKWGVTETYNMFEGGRGRYVPGYIEGKDAGSLELMARALNLGGSLRGSITLGPYQRLPATGELTGYSRAYDELALAGALTLGDGRGGNVGGRPDYGLGDFALRSLSGLGAEGVGQLNVYSNGRISLAAGERLDLGPGGGLSLTGWQVDLAGDIVAHGGSVTAATELTSTNSALGSASIRVRNGASLDTSGIWVNDVVGVPAGELPSGPAFIEGGDVSMAAENGSLALDRGSSIDTSGGAQRTAAGELKAGRGGDITLAVSSGYDATLPQNGATALTINGDLRSDALEQGGALRLKAPAFLIGSGASTLPAALRLPASFFSGRGFSEYVLQATFNGIDLTRGTELDLTASNRVLDQAASLQAASGADFDSITSLATLPDYLRQPVSLTLAHKRASALISTSGSGVTIGTGARVSTDAGGAISLSSDAKLIVDGTLSAPAGRLTLTETAAPGPDYDNRKAIWLGPNARLLAPAAFVTQPTALPGFEGKVGEVLDAGSVTVSAQAGYLFADARSVIDVSGAAYDLAVQEGPYVNTYKVAGEAGTIGLNWSQGGVLAGTLNGRPAPVGGAAGGTLKIVLNDSLQNTSGGEPQVPFPAGPNELRLTPALPAIPPPGGAVPTSASLARVLSVDTVDLTGGGFDTIALRATPAGVNFNTGRVNFVGDVKLKADRQLVIDAPVIASDGGDVSLGASHVMLGYFGSAGPASPTGGSGTLAVNAGLLDLIGSVSLQGFGGAPVQLSSRGDVRLTGSSGRIVAGADGLKRAAGALRSAADVSINAKQIYATTLSDYELRVERAGGTLRIGGGDTSAPVPLSAAGRIALTADNVEQGGVLRAPFGAIDIRAADSVTLASGSLTSVSGRGRVVPFGITELAQADWLYRFSASVAQEINAAPTKAINLESDSITLAAGSVVDVTGGGDLLASEWVPGPGGSSDILGADNTAGAFAIVPTLGSSYAAFDPYLSNNDPSSAGRTFRFDGAPGLAAGEYAILPAAYALLPGAFLITPQDTTGLAPGAVTRLPDGALLATGRYGYAGTSQADSVASAFLVENGAQVRARAEYAENRADSYFGGRNDGPVLNRDAGQLTLNAVTTLQLGGTLAQASTGGRGSQVDILADRLSVVGVRSATAQAGIVELVASELNTLRADSLSLGAARARDGSVVDIDVDARSVEVKSDAALEQKEVLLAGREAVNVRSGARISAAGGDAKADTFRLTGDAALVRASGGEQVDVQRSGLSGTTGSVTLETGSTLEVGDGSVTIDVSRNAVLAGDIRTQQGSVSLGASRISIGTPSGPTAGLVLGVDDLQAYDASELRLNSRSTVDTYGGLSLALDRVSIDAAGLGGYVNGGQTVAIEASSISLSNRADRAFAGAPGGEGTLSLSAGRIDIADGDFGVRGFGLLRATATEQLTLGGGGNDAALRVAGDVDFRTSRLTTGAGVDTIIAATNAAGDVVGRVDLLGAGAGAGGGEVSALGGRVDVTGTAVTLATRIELPSGIVNLRATGAEGLALNDGAVIDVAGNDIDFGDAVLASAGGRVGLVADAGGIDIAAGARVDASSGAAGNNAGRVDMAAAGDLNLDPGAVLRAFADAAFGGGRFSAAVDRLVNGFSALNAQLASGGYRDSIEVRQGSGKLDIAADDVVRAREVTLSADGGSMTVAGRIDARHRDGGAVRLAARDDLTLIGQSGIDARATGTEEDGGTVFLASLQGEVALAADSEVNVAGTDAAGAVRDDGRVHIRAPRAGNGVGISTLAGEILGAERIDLEAFRTYVRTTLGASSYGAIAADSAAYMANAGSIKSSLGVASDPRVHLLAGEEVQSSGDLTVSEPIDLLSRRPGGEAGVLTLRAARDLKINGSLSDGVAFVSLDPDNGAPERDVVQTGDSWSYRLVGGADLSGADPLATLGGAGDVTLASGVRVRTGRGDVEVAAGRDIRLADTTAAIYTMGSNRGGGQFSLGPFDESLRTLISEILYEADFLENGGDVALRAGGDIVAAATDQFITDWLYRVAGQQTGSFADLALPASWAINVGEFRQGIAALGGGDVIVEAGGTLEHLSVMLPTTAQPQGDAGTLPAVAGGGDLIIEAGGDMIGGQYYVERGSAAIDVGGLVDNANQAAAKTVLAAGDASIAVRARKAAVIESAVNPSVLPQVITQGLESFVTPVANYLFTYGDSSSVSITSTAGDVVLRGNENALKAITPAGTRLETGSIAYFVLPPTVAMHSLQGSVRFGVNKATLFPATGGNLDVVAADSVGLYGGSTNLDLILSDADVNLLPSVSAPAVSLAASAARLDSPRTSSTANAARPVHLGDVTAARVIARDGILGIEEQAGGAASQARFSLYLAKQTRVRAGSISNLDLSLQHANANDISVIASDGDIRFPSQRDPSARIQNNNNAFRIEGPGRLDVITAGDIDLGASAGIISEGNRRNPALADAGADVSVLAGVDPDLAYDDFIDKYLAGGEYASWLTGYLGERGIPVGADALQTFKGLSRAEQRPLVLAVLFNEIGEAGKEASAGDTSKFQRGYDATEALFGQDDSAGDLSMLLSTITTLDGGDINLVAPRGGANLGVSNVAVISDPDKLARLGVIVEGQGDINALVGESLLVNQTRVFALGGGDVTIWSERGDIDAGSGAKTALSVKESECTFNFDGLCVSAVPPQIAGNGIKTAGGGDVALFAPQGIVNAGDAGISSAGNITIAAVQVIGADNISAGGVSVGVPTVSTGSLAAGLAGAGDVAAAATKSVTEAATTASAAEGEEQAAEAAKALASALSFISVEFLGYGEG